MNSSQTPYRHGHSSMLEKGVAAWNQWRKENPDIVPDLFKAQFRIRNLTHANLTGARLCGAGLESINLSGADLANADLSHASLWGTNLTSADLGGANLHKATLWSTVFVGTRLQGTNFDQAKMAWAILAALDLSNALNLETVVHSAPSTIGIDTIYASQGKIPDTLLAYAGVPEEIVEIARSLRTGRVIQWQSCFISHSTKDEEFARRLHVDLQNKGVRCWLFSEDAKWGETVWGEIDREIKIYNKLVVVCSENSLQSPAVLREIERALQREDRERNNVLFPIRLDDYIFEGWEHERKADVVRKVVGDFRRWKELDVYEKSFARLLQDLRAEETRKA